MNSITQRLFLFLTTALCSLGYVSAQSSTSAAVLGVAIDLLDASHILHFLDVVDAYGHISVRNPDNSSQFLMTFAIAPAQATSQSIVTYEIDNATAVGLTFNSSIVGSAVPTGFAERYIHSEIFKKFPTILSVVHTHTLEILPFANQEPGKGVPLVSQMHTAPAIGSKGAPIFDTRKLSTAILPEDQLHDLLVRNELLGDALAGTFESGSQVVLMRGHGMAIRAPSLRQAVFDAFYVKQDATVQLQGILLGGGKVSPIALDAREVQDTATTAATLVGRAWSMWVAQVDKDGFYTNDLRNGAKPSLVGF